MIPRKILVATDFSPLAAVGVDVALGLARRMHARLHVVHVLEPVALLGAADIASIERKRRVEAREKLEAIDAADVVITREILTGVASRELVTASEHEGVDLIVIASHGYGRIRRAVLGSVAASLIRLASVPVLVVGPERRGLDFDVVVAAVDLSPISREVIEQARTYVVPDGMVQAVWFFEQPLVMADDLLPYYPTQEERDRMTADQITAVRALIPNDDGAETRVEVIAKASAALGILDTAELVAADLVVVGTSGHNAWHRAFIGSTATRVLSEAKCPVLVVPTSDATLRSGNLERPRTVEAPWHIECKTTEHGSSS